MRRITSLLLVAVLSAGALLLTATPSGASVAAKTSKFCKELKNVDSSNIGNPTSKKGARKALRELRRLEGAATGNTKTALHTIVDAYERIADGESASRVFTRGGVIKALGTFALAAGKCFASDLPNITLPDITLPKLGT
ncbi:MAG TPA: hypothetical protein VIH82_03895 [Acidimicrobiia bacterium]|jgi:hypothetical protein